MLRKWLVCSTTLDVSCKIYRHYLQKPGFGICFIQNNWCWQASLRRVADCQWPSWYLADCLFYCLVITFCPFLFLALFFPPRLFCFLLISIQSIFLLTLHIVFSLWGTLSLKTPSFWTFFSLVIPLSICSRLVQREQGLSMKIFDYTPRLLTLLTSLTPSPPALKPFFLLCFTHPNPHNPQTPSTLFVSTCLHSANEWCQLRWKLNKQCILQREITKTCLHLIMVVCWISRLWITSCTCF